MILSERQWKKTKKAKDVPEDDEASYSKKSLLSVIADSAEVLVWVIKREMLEYLSQEAKKNIISRIRLFTDEDRPNSIMNVKEQRASMQKWETFKEKLALSIMKTTQKSQKIHYP